jgi:hypothetical protein
MVLGGGMAAAAVGGDDAVVMQLGGAEGEETVVTVNCPDQTGLGCDLCRTILEFGLRITRAGTSPLPIGQIHRFFSSFPDLFFHRYLSASSALPTTESLSPFFYTAEVASHHQSCYSSCRLLNKLFYASLPVPNHKQLWSPEFCEPGTI